MNTKEYVVRIVKPSSKPALPKADHPLGPKPRKNKIFPKKASNILLGSGMGFGAGLVIYLMLKVFGINFGGVESTLIIGFPSVLGIFTSLAIF